LKYKTLVNKRVVYGGGGIMPDVFVSADTSYNSQYFNRLYAKNVLNTFVLDYYDKNRGLLNSRYKSFDEFKKKFQFSPVEIQALIAKGETEGVKYNEEQFNVSKEEILLVLKGLIATNLYQTSEYFQIINENDKVIEKALSVISDKKSYNKLIGNQ
jgi:carboxyl-terminal processing protease